MRITNIFDDFFNDWFDRPTSRSMRTDIKEDDKQYVLYIELPGLEKEDIKLSYENEYLVVSVDAKEDNEEYIRKERYSGELSREYYVGNIDESKLTAEYNNGILVVTVPKDSVQETKKYISIK